MTYRIGTITAGLMIGVAVLVDGLQFLLTLTVIGSLVAMLVSAFAWITFVLWFALLGVSYFDRGAATRGLILLSSIIVELIPLVNALPATTLGVVALVIHTRIEDKKRMNLPQNASGNQGALRRAAEAAKKSNLIQAARVARQARAEEERERT